MDAPKSGTVCGVAVGRAVGCGGSGVDVMVGEGTRVGDGGSVGVAAAGSVTASVAWGSTSVGLAAATVAASVTASVVASNGVTVAGWRVDDAARVGDSVGTSATPSGTSTANT